MEQDPRAHGPRVHLAQPPYLNEDAELLSIGVTSDGVIAVVRSHDGVVRCHRLISPSSAHGPGVFMKFIE